MAELEERTRLRVLLTDSAVRKLKGRASARGQAIEGYVDMILRYALHERLACHPADQSAAPSSRVYLAVEIPVGTRSRLAHRNEARMGALADFAGWLIDAYLERYERDPRDLAMIHYVTSLLDHKVTMTDVELRTAISYCDNLTGLRLPPDHTAKWLYSRLRPLVQQIEVRGKIVELSLEMFQSS